MSLFLLALTGILLLWTSVLLVFARPLLARWREPVFRYPILILESDDWGAGPLAQAEALACVSALLQRIRDASDRPALMSLGVVLEVPDGARIAASGCQEYHGLTLLDARFDKIRAAMQDGIHAGVFAPQLHGQCHYWPPAVLTAAQTDTGVRDWLTTPEPATTENLPSHLQSRWIDASQLPSCALPAELIQQAVLAEAATYHAIFGEAPRVAVATTFVWNNTVEAAWRTAGVEVVITPGHRAICRNAAGHTAGKDATMLTGQCSPAGQRYLVRDVYFEPTLGHVPERLLKGLQQRTEQGRACLVELHRFNFLQALDDSLATLETALRAALDHCPSLRFIAPLELAQAIQTQDPNWVETRLMPRLAAWQVRVDEIPRFRRLTQLSGLTLLLTLLKRAA